MDPVIVIGALATAISALAATIYKIEEARIARLEQQIDAAMEDQRQERETWRRLALKTIDGEAA